MTLLFLCTGRAKAFAQSTAANDLAHRDTAIHWPKHFDPRTAPVFSHNELLIHADCHRVWSQFTRVTDWPEWLILTKDVSLDGTKTLQSGSLLRLKIFNTPITARIDEFVPESRISWIPASVRVDKHQHYHIWHFIPEPGGCRVVTEETGVGAADIADAKASSRLMHRAHDLWLASLKWKSEE